MSAPARDAVWIHASCIAVAGAGILIRGASGAGKSTLALLLLDRAALTDRPAGLVGDDRIGLTRLGDTVLARPHPALGARIEVRGVGLLEATAASGSAPLRLVVDLVAARPRLPDAPMTGVDLLGLTLPGLTLDPATLRSGLAPRLVLDALAACQGVTGGTDGSVLMFPKPSEP